MSQPINIQVVGYNKSELNRTINTQFTQLITPEVADTATETPSDSLTVDQFFNAYSRLFYEIPKTGDTNSHEYLVKQSSEYIGGEQVNSDILALQNEITQLRQENLELQGIISNLETVK
jgi:hypothetical protein